MNGEWPKLKEAGQSVDASCTLLPPLNAGDPPTQLGCDVTRQLDFLYDCVNADLDSFTSGYCCPSKGSPTPSHAFRLREKLTLPSPCLHPAHGCGNEREPGRGRGALALQQHHANLPPVPLQRTRRQREQLRLPSPVRELLRPGYVPSRLRSHSPRSHGRAEQAVAGVTPSTCRRTPRRRRRASPSATAARPPPPPPPPAPPTTSARPRAQLSSAARKSVLITPDSDYEERGGRVGFICGAEGGSPGTAAIGNAELVRAGTGALGQAPSMRWFFDAATQTCRTFAYLGQGGNFNNFASREDCEGFCGQGWLTRSPSRQSQ